MTKLKIKKFTEDSYTFLLCFVKVSLSKTPGKKLRITFSGIVKKSTYCLELISFIACGSIDFIDADTPLTELFELTILA